MDHGLGKYAHALLRLGAGLLFFEHGLQKVFGLLGGFGAPGTTAPLVSQFGVAGLLELIGGALLVVGLFTRPVALVLMVEMVVAYVIVHAPQGGWPVQNDGELALLYGLVLAYMAAAGAGPLSIDKLVHYTWKRERRRPERHDRRNPYAVSL